MRGASRSPLPTSPAVLNRLVWVLANPQRHQNPTALTSGTPHAPGILLVGDCHIGACALSFLQTGSSHPRRSHRRSVRQRQCCQRLLELIKPSLHLSLELRHSLLHHVLQPFCKLVVSGRHLRTITHIGAGASALQPHWRARLPGLPPSALVEAGAHLELLHHRHEHVQPSGLDLRRPAHVSGSSRTTIRAHLRAARKT